MSKGQYRVLAITLPAMWFLCTTTLHAGEPTRSATAAHEKHIMLTPQEIKWGACPPEVPPGAQCAVIEGDPSAPNALHAFRAKMPDKFRIPAHFHPVDEHLVVLSGVFNMGLGDKLDEKNGSLVVAFECSPDGLWLTSGGHFRQNQIITWPPSGAAT